MLLNIENWAEVPASFATPLIVMADLLDDHACRCLASFYLQVQIRMTIPQMAVEIGSVSILGCHFLLTRSTLDGQAIVACLSRLL